MDHFESLKVVVNHEEQYSIWPAERECPVGWHEVGFEGGKEACLKHIEEIWTDMRPLSLRKKMDELANEESERVVTSKKPHSQETEAQT